MFDSIQQKTEYRFVSVDSFFRFNEAGPVMYLIGIQYLSPLSDILAEYSNYETIMCTLQHSCILYLKHIYYYLSGPNSNFV